jgi:preprotein translocase subunit Sec61beta
MAKKQSKTNLPMSQGGLLNFGGQGGTSLISFSPEAVLIASAVFALLIAFFIKANPLGF